MTCREKLAMEYPEYVDKQYVGGARHCPHDYGYLKRPDYCPLDMGANEKVCKRCWDREIPDESKENLERRK